MGEDPQDRRLQRIEESVGYAQHDAATQAAELRDLSRQVYELTQRTERLERRLREALSRLPTPTNLDAEADRDPSDPGDAAGGDPASDKQ